MKKIILVLMLIFASLILETNVNAESAANQSISQEEYLNNANMAIELAAEFKSVILNTKAGNFSQNMSIQDIYSGMYIDDTGELVICYKNPNIFYYKYVFEQYLESNHMDLYEQNWRIDYMEFAFSYSELQYVKTFLSDNASELQIKSLGIIQSKNVIEVGVEDEFQKNSILSFLENNLVSFDERMLEFSIYPTHAYLNSNYYANPGTAIKFKWLFWYYDNGTIGFNAYDPASGKYGIVTNAHVVYGRTNWYNDDNKLIGTVTYSTMESGPVDAAFITFTNTSSVTWVPSYEPEKPDGSTTYLSDVIPEAYIVEGAPVYRIGITTGYTIGQITVTDSTYYNIPYPDGNEYDISNIVRYSNTGQPGDSGGPVWYAEGSRGPAHYLMAIHFASDPEGNGCGIRVSNIIDDFGIIPVVSP